MTSSASPSSAGPDGHGPPPPPLYRALRFVLTPVVRALTSPVIEGLDDLPDRGPAILCSNHLSNLDPVVLSVVVPRPIFYLGKSEYFHGVERRLFESLGVMPVAREGGAAGEASLARGQEILETGAFLGIFPEGTRSVDGRLYRARTGAIRLAARTDAPIVPIGLVGTRELMPPHARVPRRGRVTVRFAPPLGFGALADDDHAAVRRAAEVLMAEIARLTGQEQVDEYAARSRPEP